MSAAAGCTGGDGSIIVGGAAAEPIEIAPLLPLVPLGIAALYPPSRRAFSGC